MKNLPVLPLLISACWLAASSAAGRPLRWEVAQTFARVGTNGWLVDRKGEAFVPLGGFYANWPGDVKRGSRLVSPPHDLMPDGWAPYRYPYTPETVAQLHRWFAYLRDSGVTAQRLMLRQMDVVGRVHPVYINAVLEYMDIARKYDLKFQLVLFEDFGKPPYLHTGHLESYAIPSYTADELKSLPPHRARFLVEKRMASDKFRDPDVLACQKDYLRELIPILMKRPEVFAYELENEMDPQQIEWVAEIVRFIKSIDPETPVIGNPVELGHPRCYRWQTQTDIDILNYHPYNHGDSVNGVNTYHATVAKRVAMGGPSYAGEAALNSSTGNRAPEWEAARMIRDVIWPTIMAGAVGCMMWTPQYRAEVEEFGKAYRILKDFDLAHFRKKKAPLAVVLPDVMVPEGQRGTLLDEMRWVRYSLVTGTDFDFVPEPDEGRVATVNVKDWPRKANVGSVPRSFETTSGWYVQYLISENDEKSLIYLANRGGGVRLMPSRCWMRSKKAVRLWLRHSLCSGTYSVTIYDLDTNKERNLTVQSPGWLDLGETGHDYVVRFART